jgi:hypothetical protein
MPLSFYLFEFKLFFFLITNRQPLITTDWQVQTNIGKQLTMIDLA